MSALAVLKLVHVALALFAVGTNLSFPIWVRIAERETAHLAFVLRSVRWIDRFVTIPAYGLVALTGLALALAEGVPLTTLWLGGALALFAAVILAGALLYAPVSRARLAAAERGSMPDYGRERRRAERLDLFIIPAVLVILALMVWRPA